MDFTLVEGLYLSDNNTFEDFLKEWGEGDQSNIPFRFDSGNIWIYQPRKEMVYSIGIIDSDLPLVNRKIKAIIRKGLKQINEDLRLE